MISARFDDLRPRRRRSFRLDRPVGTIEARTIAEVPSAIDAAERAVASGRWVGGWVSYESAPAFDDALVVRPTSGTPLADLPLVWFGVFEGRTPTSEPSGDHRLGSWVPTVDGERHRAGVERIRRHIQAGETYQVNHTFRMHAPFTGDPADLYRRLSRAQSCGYGAHLDAGRWAVASASPELFFEWRHGRLMSKPMKGTARRGLDLISDEEQRHWLQTSEKNRAENLMIVDMVRNDMGRVAVTGSVSVPEMFTTEKYDTVWQLTSTVAARTRSGTELLDVFGALFPCASITGAPKVATMAIIAELEADPRGVYCGAIGFGGPGPAGPEWAFNVGIRTVLVDRTADTAWYGTGGGVTYDSTPEGEYQEALLKAEVLARHTTRFELLETMRWTPADGFHHLDRHLRRLSDSAWYFDIPLDTAEVRTALHRAIARLDAPTRVRLTVDRAGWVQVSTEPAPRSPTRPIMVAIDDVPIPRHDPFLRHKTTVRRVYEEAAARHPGAEDVILINEHGDVTETTIANLAARVDGQWRTPPIESGCLPGVERSALIGRGTLVEKPISLADLHRADSLARLNSLRGWEPLRLAKPSA